MLLSDSAMFEGGTALPVDVKSFTVWRELPLGADFLIFPGGSDGKESACNVGDLGSVPGQGRSPGEGKGYPLQYSGLPGELHGQRRLASYSPWCHGE